MCPDRTGPHRRDVDLAKWAEYGVDVEALLGIDSFRSSGGAWLHTTMRCRSWRPPTSGPATTQVTGTSRLCHSCWSTEPDVEGLVQEGMVLESVLEVLYSAQEDGPTTRGFGDVYHVAHVTSAGVHRGRQWAGALRRAALSAYSEAFDGQIETVRRLQLETFLDGSAPSGEEELLLVPALGAGTAISVFGDLEVRLLSSWWEPHVPAPGLLLRAPREVTGYLRTRLRYAAGEYTDEIRPSTAALEPGDTPETVETAALLVDPEGGRLATIEAALQTARALNRRKT